VVIRHDSSVSGLAIDLPAGRSLYYRDAQINPFTDKLRYQATGRAAGSIWVDTYGGRLVENITQAVARDLLAITIKRLESLLHYDVVAHVHDEVIVEVPVETAEKDLATIIALMSDAPVWAENLPLNADGYLCKNYRKE